MGAGDIAGSGSGDSQTAAIIAALPPTTQVFTLGDNVYETGTIDEFATYYEPTWGQFKARTHPVVGNHDSHDLGAPGYFDYFEPHTQVGNRGEGWYAYDAGDWRVIVLNSECNGSLFDFCDHDAQKAWLQSELAANPRTCTAAMWHRPMVAPSATHTDDEGNFLDVWQILYDGGVDLVLNGHDHLYARFAPYNRDANGVDANGIRQFIAGTGGRSHYTVTESKPGLEASDGSTFGVLKLTLQSGSFNWQFLPVSGTFTDSGSGSCRAQLPGTATPTTAPASTTSPAATPSPTPTPTPTPSTTATSAATPTTSPPTPSPTPTPTPTPSATPTQTPTPTPTPTPGAGIAFQAAATTVNTAALPSLVIPKPAGTAAGDVLVASLALNGATVSSAPTGWVQIVALTTLQNPKAYSYYRVAGASEPANYTWTFSASVVSSGGIARYTGVSTVNPLDAQVSTATSPSAVAITVPGVTTISPNSMLVGGVALNSGNPTVAITAPAGMTEHWDVGTNAKRQEYDDALQLAAGSSGSKTWTFSNARAGAAWLAALRPSP